MLECTLQALSLVVAQPQDGINNPETETETSMIMGLTQRALEDTPLCAVGGTWQQS